MEKPAQFRVETNRLHSVLGYGLRAASETPENIIVVAPQTRRWGATTQQRDLLTLIQEKVSLTFPSVDRAEIKATCLYAGKPPAYTQKAFDEVLTSHFEHFPKALEILLVPGVMLAAVVHAPLGSSSGNPVPLGLASFDPGVVERGSEYIMDRFQAYTTT